MKKYILLSITILFIASGYSQGPSSRNEAKIDQVYSQYGLTGKGTLVIMMDRGIDYEHPDFIDAAGNTRIAYIYDLLDNTGANDPNNHYGVGTIYDRDDINQSLSNNDPPISFDLFGHGTATTGIIAGNGSAVSSSHDFKGVAYEATIISIIISKDYVPPFGNSQGQPGQFDASLLKYAFEFANEKTLELDLPSVTLLNIGSMQDPTDGNTKFCEYADEYVSNGNTFVCGVGDEGGKDNHIIKDLFEGETTEIIFRKGEDGFFRFSSWYAENDRFEFTIERPDGKIEGTFSSPELPTDIKDEFLDGINIYHRGKDVEFSESNSNLRQLMIDITAETGVYKLSITPTTVTSNSQINGFMYPAFFYDSNEFLNNDTPGGNIHSYSACELTISPGDYVASDTYTDIDGNLRTRINDGTIGELWHGSSIGPTMDGRLGIDLTAPGEIAWAAYSKNSYYSNFRGNVLENSEGYYGIQTAVSAAAPIVTGVISLMLEVNPDLTPHEIKTILQESSRSDSFTETTPNNQWGYGKLDALEAIKQTFIFSDTEDLTSSQTDLELVPNPASNFVSINNMGMGDRNIIATIYDTKGSIIKDKISVIDGSIDISELTNGVYILNLNSKKISESRILIKK